MLYEKKDFRYLIWKYTNVSRWTYRRNTRSILYTFLIWSKFLSQMHEMAYDRQETKKSSSYCFLASSEGHFMICVAVVVLAFIKNILFQRNCVHILTMYDFDLVLCSTFCMGMGALQVSIDIEVWLNGSLQIRRKDPKYLSFVFIKISTARNGVSQDHSLSQIHVMSNFCWSAQLN